MSDVTISALRGKVDQLLTLNRRKKDLDAEIETINKQMLPIENEIKEVMAALEMERFEGSLGKVTLQKQDYVNSPKDENKDAFFNYLKEIGQFENLASVHYGTLNTWFKEQNEMALEEGRELNIPGLERMTRTTLVKRK